MKTRCLVLAGLLLIGTARLGAQGGPPPWAGQGQGRSAPADANGAPVDQELAAIERFLSMSDDELDRLQQAIARVRSMSPSEREVLRARMLEYRRLPAPQREQVQRGWGWLNDEDRRDWPSMMRSKSPDERAAIQAELEQLPTDQRAARKHELLKGWRAGTARAQED